MESRKQGNLVLLTEDAFQESMLRDLITETTPCVVTRVFRSASCANQYLRTLAPNDLLGIVLESHLIENAARELDRSLDLVPLVLLTNDGDLPSGIPQRFLNVSPTNRRCTTSIRRMLESLMERQQLRDTLARAEKRLALIANGMVDGLWEWEIVGQTLSFSSRSRSILGIESDGDICSPIWMKRIDRHDFEQFRSSIEDHLLGKTTIFECEFRLKHPKGGSRWIHCRGASENDERGRPIRLAGSLSDTTKHKLVEEQLQHDAFHDVLTGLPNRVVLVDLLDRAIARGWRRPESGFALLTLDIDRFKVVNDSVGHSAGDRMLVAITRRLRACVRPADTIVRLGSDEFAILLEDITNLTDVLRVADRIHREFRQPIIIDQSELFATFSIGIAVNHSNHHKAEEVIRDADTAMHRAKDKGRARTEIFDQSMRESAMSLLRLDTDLRKAVARNEFHLNYQPIISLQSGEIVAFEALARWNHPEYGPIPPTEFIPLAEENGLILAIGQWVLHEACRQTRYWQRRFPHSSHLGISVNLSCQQFGQPDLVRQIDRICSNTGIRQGTLRLEITESVMIQNAENTRNVLEQLHCRDIELHVDDFGTGYSSLSTLPSYPVDTMKIDRSFIAKMDDGGANSQIVRTIVALGQHLNLNVTAEGVETKEQFSILRELKCTHGQGYYFSRPLDKDAAEQLLARRHCWLEHETSF